MKQNGYKIISYMLTELSRASVMKQGTKRLFKNIKKDPTSAAMVAIPAPGSAPAGVALHLAKNKGSRKTLKTMATKAINPNRIKAGDRMAAKLKQQKRNDMRKYLNISKSVS